MGTQGTVEFDALGQDDGNIFRLPQTALCSEPLAPKESLTPAMRQRLGVLRELLAKSRLEGDNDIEGAFARLTADPSADASAFGVTLFHTLARAADRRLVFFCRVCQNASEDEWWLLRLIDCVLRRDIASVDALLGFRIHKAWRRRIKFLAAGLAARIDAAIVSSELADGSAMLNVAL